MATVGLVLLLFTGLVPGLLKLTTSTSMPQVFTRPTARTFVGTVSPSAVWYTSTKRNKTTSNTAQTLENSIQKLTSYTKQRTGRPYRRNQLRELSASVILKKR